MDKKAVYNVFPPPKSPQSPTATPRSRRSIDRRKRSTSLDPLPPIEEPPDPPPVPDSPREELPVLKPIHSLYNPRPPSRRKTSEEQQPLSQHQDPAYIQHPDLPPTPSRRLSLGHSPPPTAFPPSEQQPPPPPRPHSAQEMHVPSPSTDSSLSLQKPPVLSPTSTLAVQPSNPPQQKVAYFHGGIGGRGNYRKVVREHNRAPLAHARNVSPPGGRSARFLSSLFGSARRRLGSPTGSGTEVSSEARTSQESFGSSEREEVSLGAAEVMRRKLLRQAGVIPK